MKIKIICIIILALLMGTMITSADTEAVNVVVDGKVIDFNASGQFPIVEDGRTLIPLRGVFEELGFEVIFDEKSQSVNIKNDYATVTLWNNDKMFAINNVKSFSLDVPARITENNRFVVPIRPIIEAFKLGIVWEPDTNSVLISSHIKNEHDIITTRVWDKATGNYGLINNRGEFVVEPKFRWIYRFSEGLAQTSIDGRTVFINYQGEEVFEIKGARNIGEFSDGLVRVSFVTEEKVDEFTTKYIYTNKYLDREGRTVFETSLNTGNFSEGLATYAVLDEKTQKYKYGYINKKGEIVIDSKFDFGEPFSEGLALVTIGGSKQLSGYIDREGNWVVEAQYRGCGKFVDGLAVVGVIKGDKLKMGVIDRRGKFVIPAIYDGAQDYFSEGLLGVSLLTPKGREDYYIDRTGKVVITLPENYWLRMGLEDKGFVEGVSVISHHKKDGYLDKGYGYMDKSGRIIIEPQFGLSYEFVGGLAEVSKDFSFPPKRAFINIYGKIVYDLE